VAYIPQHAQWYVAVLVLEIRVEGEGENVVHKNLILLRGDDPEDAYGRAHEIGKNSECSYRNPHGRLVQIRFRGLNDLNVVYDKLEDGAELKYEELIGVPEEEVQALLRAKHDLPVFRPMTRSKGPDYSSEEVLQDAIRLIEGTRS